MLDILIITPGILPDKFINLVFFEIRSVLKDKTLNILEGDWVSPGGSSSLTIICNGRDVTKAMIVESLKIYDCIDLCAYVLERRHIFFA
ncbi:hypothetical protein O9G_005129 [Rozella allomycis CSF55]|uniref:Uncharacterized protein n=1 Tax=Rozella allomycis (strain CSF55) TaxID=988480 RepID=A0A075B3Y3_ROZAC|nr:hypothetical protein O9G_005129 [Rozella allomycis CSF55]|eukprot:EPZ35683.1 hypothetical protein O9G_005129 [Rozella allomycis CSF55]